MKLLIFALIAVQSLAHIQQNGWNNGGQPQKSNGWNNGAQPHNSNGWNNGAQPHKSNGWNNGGQPHKSNGWNNGGQPLKSNGWNNGGQPLKSNGWNNGGQPEKSNGWNNGGRKSFPGHQEKILDAFRSEGRRIISSIEEGSKSFLHSFKSGNGKSKPSPYSAPMGPKPANGMNKLLTAIKSEGDKIVKSIEMEKNKIMETLKKSKCADKSEHCPYWAKKGECENNPFWMQINCAKSCNTCGKTLENIVPPTTPQPPPPVCENKNKLCGYWRWIGECDKNPAYMNLNCAKKCGLC